MIYDEELCQQVQEGSEAALEALVHRHHQPLFAYLYRLMGNRSAAEDLTQEAFVRMMTRIGTYRFPEPFRPWLYTIAHNLFKDHCKAAYNQTTIPTADPVPDAFPEPIDLVGRMTERAEVMSAIRALEPAQREVLLLRYYQDLKVEEIARVLGIPSGTVKSRLFGAMRKLRGLLTPDQAAGGRGAEA